MADRESPTRTNSSSGWTAPASGFAITIFFATCSLLEAQRTFPERIPELQRRAAAWFESQHDHARAVEHRLAAGDLDSGDAG